MLYAVATQTRVIGYSDKWNPILKGSNPTFEPAEKLDISKQPNSYQSEEHSSEGQDATRAMTQMSAISPNNCMSNEYLARLNLSIQSDKTSSSIIDFLNSQRDKQLSVCERVFRDELKKISDYQNDDDLEDIQLLREAIIKIGPKIQPPTGSDPIKSNIINGIIRFMISKRNGPFDIRIIRNQNIGKRYVSSEFKRLVVDLCDRIRPDLEPLTVFYESSIEAESDLFAKIDSSTRDWVTNLRICRLIQLRLMEISDKIFKVLLK